MPERAGGVEELVEFGHALRREGIAAGTGAIADFCRAASLVPRRELYWAGRLTLVSRRDQLPAYDRAFGAFFGGGGVPLPPRTRPRPRPAAAPAAAPGEDAQAGEAAPPAVALASRAEVLRRKRFDECTREELDEIAALAVALVRRLPHRRSRRLRGATAGPLDVPRTLRRALRTGGEPFERRFRARRTTQRPVVLLVDVSGSMSGFARALLVLAHALVRERPLTHVLCFGTRLTDVTRALRTRDPDDALARAAAQVADWEGGTRIGEAVKAFLDDGGHRGGARGAVVVVCSDGLDVGDPEVLREQMQRLARLAHRVVWLNPLKRDPAYEPLARGMRAALPSIDVFAGGHDLASLEWAATQLAGRGARPRPASVV